MNLVELISEDNEQEPSPCHWGNIVIGHACYCHNKKSPYRKCPQWRNQEPFGECKYFKPAKAI